MGIGLGPHKVSEGHRVGVLETAQGAYILLLNLALRPSPAWLSLLPQALRRICVCGPGACGVSVICPEWSSQAGTWQAHPGQADKNRGLLSQACKEGQGSAPLPFG